MLIFLLQLGHAGAATPPSWLCAQGTSCTTRRAKAGLAWEPLHTEIPRQSGDVSFVMPLLLLPMAAVQDICMYAFVSLGRSPDEACAVLYLTPLICSNCLPGSSVLHQGGKKNARHTKKAENHSLLICILSNRHQTGQSCAITSIFHGHGEN